jgi:hypothetical protein
MNWKSTAVVSGATLLAGWLASAPPGPIVSVAPPPPSRSPQTAAAASDIEQQAARLSTRLRRDSPYAEPERNLFRFGPKAAVKSAAPGPQSSAASPPVQILPQAPPPPPVSLSGVASDPDGQRTVRTAILSSPSGVLLVHEGDDVLGQYRVGAIGEDAVELTRLSDGTSFRITLKP